MGYPYGAHLYGEGRYGTWPGIWTPIRCAPEDWLSSTCLPPVWGSIATDPTPPVWNPLGVARPGMIRLGEYGGGDG